MLSGWEIQRGITICLHNHFEWPKLFLPFYPWGNKSRIWLNPAILICARELWTIHNTWTRINQKFDNPETRNVLTSSHHVMEGFVSQLNGLNSAQEVCHPCNDNTCISTIFYTFFFLCAYQCAIQLSCFGFNLLSNWCEGVSFVEEWPLKIPFAPEFK